MSSNKTGKRARVLAITSGKGGVGKTNVSTNLAIALARQGSRVCVFDADTSLANVNILLGIQPELTLEHLLDGRAGIEDIMVKAPGDIAIIPAASGIAEFTRLTPDRQKLLLDALKTLEQTHDYLIIDTAAGIGSNVTLFLQSVEHCLLVVTPEPTSLTDAFALMKVLRQQRCETRIHILTNMVDSYPESINVYKRLSAACKRYLGTRPHYFGYIVRDDALRRAVQQQTPVMLGYPGAPVSARFMSLARSTDQLLGATHVPGAFSLFWQKLFVRQHHRHHTEKAALRPVNTVPAAKPRPRRSFNKAAIIRLQQGMAGLIRSRVLSGTAMCKLISSLLILLEKHYPEITVEDLKADSEPSKRIGTGAT